MSIVPDFILNVFNRQAAVLSWEWVPDDHCVTGDNRPLAPEPPFVVEDDYVVLRLAEMYLRTTRVLWKEAYPLVHSFVGYGDPAAPRSVAAIAGPGQLKELGTDNLDRLIGLAYRLAGPVVYDGQDIELLAGLYAVPAADGAKVLIDTLAQLSGLVPALKQVTDVANIVKGGVEGLLGISGTRLTLGIHDTVRLKGGARPAGPGYVVAINAPSGTVLRDRLWVRGGRLYEGNNPVMARPFDSHDMMMFQLERGPSRATGWATQPRLAPHVAAFDALFKNELDAAQLKSRLDKQFRAFEGDLRAIDDLSRPDKAAVRALVADDLRQRVAAIDSGGLFEKRAVAGVARDVSVRGFSPLLIADPPPGAPLPSRPEGEPVFG